jgi:hypothetical protein
MTLASDTGSVNGRDPLLPILLLLPWRATGRLSAADLASVDDALSHHDGMPGDLDADYAQVCEQRRHIIAAHDALGVPSRKAMDTLFAAIDRDIATTKNEAGL